MSWFQAPQPLLPELIVRHGRWRGERVAVTDGERCLSWGQFEQATARIANGLAAAGLRRGARIALLMDNSLEFALLLFGIMRAGCVAVVVRQSPGIFSRLTWFGYLNSETHRYAQAYLQRGIDSQRVGTKERRCNKHISFNSAFPDHRPSKYKDTVVRQQNGIIRFNHLMYAR